MYEIGYEQNANPISMCINDTGFFKRLVSNGPDSIQAVITGPNPARSEHSIETEVDALPCMTEYAAGTIQAPDVRRYVINSFVGIARSVDLLSFRRTTSSLSLSSIDSVNVPIISSRKLAPNPA
jgi:hypothetical protein